MPSEFQVLKASSPWWMTSGISWDLQEASYMPQSRSIATDHHLMRSCSLIWLLLGPTEPMARITPQKGRRNPQVLPNGDSLDSKERTSRWWSTHLSREPVHRGGCGGQLMLCGRGYPVKELEHGGLWKLKKSGLDHCKRTIAFPIVSHSSFVLNLGLTSSFDHCGE